MSPLMIESKIHATFNTVTPHSSPNTEISRTCVQIHQQGCTRAWRPASPCVKSPPWRRGTLDELQEDPLVNLCLHLPSHAFSPRSSKSGVFPKLCSKGPLHQNPPFSCGF